MFSTSFPEDLAVSHQMQVYRRKELAHQKHLRECSEIKRGQALSHSSFVNPFLLSHFIA